MFSKTLNLIRQISDLFGIPHLVGGAFLTYAPEKCIAEPEINMVGHGEGENAVKAVAEAVRAGGQLDNIAEHGNRNPDSQNL